MQRTTTTTTSATRTTTATTTRTGPKVHSAPPRPPWMTAAPCGFTSIRPTETRGKSSQALSCTKWRWPIRITRSVRVRPGCRYTSGKAFTKRQPPSASAACVRSPVGQSSGKYGVSYNRRSWKNADPCGFISIRPTDARGKNSRKEFCTR